MPHTIMDLLTQVSRRLATGICTNLHTAVCVGRRRHESGEGRTSRDEEDEKSHSGLKRRATLRRAGMDEETENDRPGKERTRQCLLPRWRGRRPHLPVGGRRRRGGRRGGIPRNDERTFHATKFAPISRKLHGGVTPHSTRRRATTATTDENEVFSRDPIQQ